MQYLSTNYPSKAAAKRDLKDGATIRVRIVEPMLVATDGKHTIAGPWYPEPHRWYGMATVDSDGKVIKIS